MIRVHLARDGSSRLEQLIRVEGGHLVLTACRLTAPGVVETGGGGLVEFLAPSTQSVGRTGSTNWPFGTPADRPTCLVTDSALATGGDVVSAEVGSGLVALWQCVVAAGGAAFALQPARVARDRLNADLWLSQCTVAAERSFVEFGRWGGKDPGPDRPWLVSTFNCAFFGTYDRPAHESALLRADADALAHGAVFWQAVGDVYEVPNLVATGDLPVPSAPRRPDVRRAWPDFWGDRHVYAVSGTRPNGQPSARLVGRLRPGDVAPGDLAIVEYPPGRRPGDLGADFTRLGITPTPPGGRRR
jgi:serine/threonine-protein kinase